VCPLHGCCFDLSTGQPAGHEFGGLKIYPVELNSKGQLILVLERNNPEA
jgi:nitrite reductase/ring-hydroxylating ferredoxin subunit